MKRYCNKFRSAILPTLIIFLIFLIGTPFQRDINRPNLDKHSDIIWQNDKLDDDQMPGFQWFWTMDGPSYGDEGSDLAIDDQGNVFLTGHHGGLDIDWDGDLELEADVIDPVIMKLSWSEPDNEAKLQWAHSAKTPGWNKGHRITADFHGGAYLMGRFRDKVEFNGGVKIIGGGGNDAYIARIGTDGQTLWAIPFGGPDADVLWDLTSDSQGNVYVIGWGKGPFQLDESSPAIPAFEKPVSIIFSYSPEGKVRWKHIIKDKVGLRFINMSPDEKIFISGEYEGQVDLDKNSRSDLPGPNGIDGFVAIYDTDGTYLNSWNIGAGPAKIAFVENNDILLLGAMGRPVEERYGVADFDGDGMADVEMNGEGPVNTWIGRFTRNGNKKWIRSYDIDRASDIVCDGNRVVMCGSYFGVRDLDDDGQPEETDRTVDPSKESEIAVIVIDPVNGTPLDAFIAPGPGNDHAASVVILPKTNVINVTGYIQLTADFSGDGKDNEGWARCEALGDIFYAEYRYR